MFSATFVALLKEAQFTKEMLGSGATQIRKADYATKGVYFQSFTSLSTGLERIGKLCLMLDYYLDTNGQFPDSRYLKNEIGHNISLIYSKSLAVIRKRSVSPKYLHDLNGEIHQNILSILSTFAQGDRYSNIDLLVGNPRRRDPVANWFERVDQLLFDRHVTAKKKARIEANALAANRMLGSFTSVRHISETNTEITSVYNGSYRTGMQSAVAPLRQLFVLQIIRFWVELSWHLELQARRRGSEDIPFLCEIFAMFYNSDSYFRTRKTWDKF